MTPVLFLGLCLAGGLGAALRLTVDGLVRGWRAADPPLGTLVVNLSGSLVLGLVTALVASTVLPDQVQTVVGTGFLGGYTTFSTASVETVRLARQGRPLATVLHGFGMLAGSVVAAASGYLLGTAV